MSKETLLHEFNFLRQQRRAARRRRYKRSRLDRYRAEIEVIHTSGGSWRDIAIWLRQYRRTKVHPTTVGRALAKWQEQEE